MSMFSKGFGSVRREQKRQEQIRESLSGKLFNFFLTEKNPEADIIFLNNQPLTFFAHTEQVSRNGKSFYDTYVCTEESNGDCPFCARQSSKASFKGAFLVYDNTVIERRDKEGKTTKAPAGLKLYIAGTRVLGQLDRMNEKYGLTSHDWEVARTGSGTATQYSFDRGEKINLTAKEIKNMLPESMAKEFNPESDDAEDVEEAVLSLVEKQVRLMIPHNTDGNIADEEDDEEAEVVSGEEAPAKASHHVSLGRKFHKK